MKYTKYKEKNFNLHVVETKKFKTVAVKVKFKRKITKEEMTIRNLLGDVLIESTRNYSTSRQMEIETEELYELVYRSNTTSSGNYNILSFEFGFLHPKYTEDNMLDRSLSFLKEIILNPNVKNKEFDESSFNIVYKNMENQILSLKENADSYSATRLFDELEPDGLISYRSCGYMEDLKKINRKNLYEYYLDVIKNDGIDIFIIGDIKPKEIRKYFSENFKFSNRTMSNDSHYYETQFKRKQVHLCTEKSEFEQSKLYMGFKAEDLTDFELKYVSYVLNHILGGTPDSKLFKNVREANSLCYSVSSYLRQLLSLLVVRAGIDADKYDLACALILSQVEDIRNGKFADEEIDSAKLNYKNALIEMEDSIEGALAVYYGIEYYNHESKDQKMEKIDTVTRNDIMRVANKIKLDTIFFLEGGGIDA